MLKTLLGAIGMTAALLLAANAPAQTMFRPIAVVNDSAITGYDLVQRAQIMTAMGFGAASADALRAAALDRLIEDRLKLQEGKRAGLVAAQENIDAGIADLAKGGGLSADEFLASMSVKGVTAQALADMVAAELVWNELVRGRFARRIEPGDAEIDAEIALMGQRSGVALKLAEIGLPAAEGGRSEDEVRALAEQVYLSLNQGGDFAAAVRQYSRAPSAARGGEVGWVAFDRLPPEVADGLAGLDVGQVGRPVPVAGGYSIIKVLDRRTDASAAVDTSDPELRERVRRRLVGQQMSRLAEGLLQELRRDALIELR